MPEQFDVPRVGTGTREWAEINENIARGCPNDCLYCYAATNAKRFHQRTRAEWHREELTRHATITVYPRRKGVIMYPSSHDITPFNVEAYIRVGRLMLEAGNTLLVVSKPRIDCIRQVLESFHLHKERVLFRFTIGTTDTTMAAHWEPGAPPPAERITALRLAFESGWRTSVSAEPLLGGLDVARVLLDAVRPYVTDTIWIGKMNQIGRRVDLSLPENLRRAREIEAAQSDAEIVKLIEALNGDPLVRWKDSVAEVMARTRPATQ
jgi:DNA repair photolyase